MHTASTSNRGHARQGTGARSRPRFAFALALALVATPGAHAAAQGRVMPPARVSCDRNQLTSYFGKVIGYRRLKAGVWLRIATDYDTVEEVTLRHPNEGDPADYFLYRGRPFTAPDWARIESKPGKLRAGMRATAWVCGDGHTVPLIDWNGAAE